MQQQLKMKEAGPVHQLTFQCPTCKSTWSELEVQRAVSKDFKFICTNCCPSENIRNIISEPYFTLVDMDTKGKLKEMLSLETKIKRQLNSSDLHDGIFDILTLLKNVTLPHNRPSTNIKLGYSSSTIVSKQTLKTIEKNSSKYRGGIQANKKNVIVDPNAAPMNKDALGRKFVIDFDDSTMDISSSSNTTGPVAKKTKLEETSTTVISSANRSTDAPEFLQSSRVKGTKQVLENVMLLQSQRNNQVEDEPEDESVDAQGAASTNSDTNTLQNAVEDEDDEDDNIEWTE